jgi:hypothetical protein
MDQWVLCIPSSLVVPLRTSQGTRGSNLATADALRMRLFYGIQHIEALVNMWKYGTGRLETYHAQGSPIIAVLSKRYLHHLPTMRTQ